jgi:hypothetical protein
MAIISDARDPWVGDRAHLKIYPNARPVQQKPRKQSVERQNFIREEIKKLLKAGFIREVRHPRWLANLVVVPKAGGKLRMCIDYTSLNKFLTGCA